MRRLPDTDGTAQNWRAHEASSGGSEPSLWSLPSESYPRCGSLAGMSARLLFLVLEGLRSRSVEGLRRLPYVSTNLDGLPVG
jgi:hypothetical protein